MSPRPHRNRPSIEPVDIAPELTANEQYMLGLLMERLNNTRQDVAELSKMLEEFLAESRTAHDEFRARLAIVEPPIQAMVSGQKDRREHHAQQQRDIVDKVGLFGVGLVLGKIDTILAFAHRVLFGH